MLDSIEIENLAVIKKTTVTLGRNLNVFTGETGSGKSVLLNGIQSVLGMRTGKDIVRNGAEKASVTAYFSNLSDSLKDKLKEYELTDEDDDVLIIKREIFSNGKTTAKINFHTVTISILKEIGMMLVNIHGQHDNQILLNNDEHIKIIDSFGKTEQLLASYTESFHNLQKCAKRLGKLQSEAAEKSRRTVSLKEQFDEISALKIEDENEEKRLESEYNIAQNSEDLMAACRNASEALKESQYSSAEMIENAIEVTGDYTEIQKDISSLISRLETAKIEITDIAEEFQRIASNCYIDENRFEYIRNRLSEIYSLKKKYCCDFAELINLRDKAEEELKNIKSNSDEIKNIQEEKSRLLKEVSEKAKELSVKRSESAKKFSEQVTSQLKFLNMENVKIEVEQKTGKLTLNGMDSLEIMISTNPGEPLKPISKIASGGELSRIMLAIKAVVADRDDVPTMIFDEIDTGVSGKAAQKIGYKLKELGKSHQILCVTHLSQIAVMADTHLLIEKNIINNSAETSVNNLDDDGRIKEISRIMGGESPGKNIIEAAKTEILKARNI
ncbi:MAG: DNA repair protein RecN [Oscillospiraceae bacterium]|nr:DNA repair protein RecN [Oscillospiraceae bacterium]